jgi:hypothetical protein
VQWNSANGLIAEDWRQIYKLISNANNAIFNISKMTTITAEEKNQFLSEIKFLRAVAYMDLTDLWGPVILATEKDLENPNYTTNATLTPLDQIEAFLINDLQGAGSALPVNYANNKFYSTNDVGRATKGAALTLLAKLYLRQHQWQKVLDVTKQVMDLNTYSLFQAM